MLVRRPTAIERKRILTTTIVVLLVMTGGTVLHESGHALACYMVGGLVKTNFVNYVECGVTEAQMSSLVFLRLAGGFFPVVLGITVLAFVRLEKLYRIALLGMMVPHLLMGILEAYAYDFYAANVNGLVGYSVYGMGIVAVLIYGRRKAR